MTTGAAVVKGAAVVVIGARVVGAKVAAVVDGVEVAAFKELKYHKTRDNTNRQTTKKAPTPILALRFIDFTRTKYMEFLEVRARLWVWSPVSDECSMVATGADATEMRGNMTFEMDDDVLHTFDLTLILHGTVSTEGLVKACTRWREDGNTWVFPSRGGELFGDDKTAEFYAELELLNRQWIHHNDGTHSVAMSGFTVEYAVEKGVCSFKRMAISKQLIAAIKDLAVADIGYLKTDR